MLIEEKIQRLNFMKEVATKFYKAQNWKKAEKWYTKINMYFRNKDVKNNFQKEDEQTTTYRDALDTLDNINKVVLTNICVLHLKKKEWKDVIKFANDVRLLLFYCLSSLYLLIKVINDILQAL